MPAPPPARFRHADTWRLLTKGEAARLSLELLPLAAKGYKAADVGLARVASSWLEVTIADGWLAAYRLVPQDGQPVIAEVRVFPAEAGRRTAGTWSGE